MSFLSPVFLLGALAAGLPILVHLVRKTRAVNMEFPSLMFLRRIEHKTIRRRRLRNLALLILRCLAIALLAIAFSRPYYKGAPAQAASDAANNVILIDGSYSMRYPGVFERAIESARNIVNNAAPSELIALALFSSNCDIVRPLKAGRAEALNLLGQMQPGLGPTDYSQALQTADSMLKGGGKGAKRIYLISDFHQPGAEHSGPPIKLAEGVEVTPLDVSDPKATNLVVSQVKADQTIYQQKYAGKVTAMVSYSACQPSGYEDAPPPPIEAGLELKLNDLVVERKRVTLEAGSPQTVEFTGFNVPEGSNRAAVEISEDRLPVDNVYFFTISRQAQAKVLSIETPARSRSESFFLEQALLSDEASPYTLTVKSSATVSPDEISQYAIVVVNDAVGITEGVAQALSKFVTAGGGLILAAGRSTDATEFNRVFEKLSPARIGDLVQLRNGSAFMSQVKLDHPIFSLFSGSGHLAPVRVYAYRAATPTEKASVIAGLDDGNPLIIEGSAGSGKVVFFGTSIDSSLNDLPLTPMYLPLIRQTLDYLSGAAVQRGCTIGQAFSIKPDPRSHLESVQDPGGNAVDLPQKDPAGAASAIASKTGFYRAKYTDRSDYIAVNLDTRESDLSKLDPKEFLARISGGARPGESRSVPDQPVTPQEIESRERLWLPLLLVSLALFVAEALMARRIRLPKTIG
ncbi:MAG TPA: BatA domain-containing protein [Blastocatellia bacterium]|nr:BatA domain-containing protein [Blastocatellia bacterium]